MRGTPPRCADTLGEARSCLAALADSATDIDQSSHFDRLLIHLDEITGDVGPATSSADGDDADLIGRLESAVNRMIDLGCDALRLELLLDSVRSGAARVACRGHRLESMDEQASRPRR